MPKRYRTNWRGTSKYSPSRRVIKRKFIDVKNKVRDSKFGHGLYYTYHVHQEPMTWIDVYFPSIYHKNRYFSAALTTLEFDGMVNDEQKAAELADAMYPNEWLDWESIPIDRKSPKDSKFYRMEFSESENWALKKEYEEALYKELILKPRMMQPTIKIDLDYWFPAIGVHATLNTPSLTSDVINKFIEDFRSLGEPITPGIVWTGEEVEVVPGKLEEQYARSSSNSIKTDID